MKFMWQLVITFLLPVLSHQKSEPTSETYIGAVAKYSPIYQDEDNKQGVKNYLKFIEKAAEYHADILVFPESSLAIPFSGNKSDARIEATSYIPDPKDKKIPCHDDYYAHTIQNISCAARQHEMYIVINHQEKVNCTENDCPADGYLVYNTNVVFDRKGAVIARYRKYNLFYEFGTNVTSEAIPSYFTTDFNVTFGQFICFDLLFKSPALNITRNLGITDIIYSTNWVSTLPFAFSFETQAAWAYANDVNFLASALNNPKTASGGAGIYIGKNGFIRLDVDHNPSNVLMVAEIPKFKNGRRSRDIDLDSLKVYDFENSEINSTIHVNESKKFLYKTVDVRQYTTELIDFELTDYNKTICDHNLCCHFEIEIEHNKNDIEPESEYYRYRLVAFNGTMSLIGAATAGVKICGIISCVNDTIDGCGRLHSPNKSISTPTNFKHVNIKMLDTNFNKENLFMPVTMSDTMMPLNVTDFSYWTESADEKNSSYTLTLTSPKKDLLTFAILGRNFDLDGSELTEPSSASKMSTSCLLLITVSIIRLFSNV